MASAGTFELRRDSCALGCEQPVEPIRCVECHGAVAVYAVRLRVIVRHSAAVVARFDASVMLVTTTVAGKPAHAGHPSGLGGVSSAERLPLINIPFTAAVQLA